jgi:hypothetical protein
MGLKHIRVELVLLLLAVIAKGRVCSAQGNPGTHLTVSIRVGPVTMNGDTTHVQYVVTNSIQSQDSLFMFTVSAPAPVLNITEPGNRTQWSAGTVWGSRSVATWGALQSLVVPGDSTPPLQFSARGLPGIDTAWYGGNYPLQSTNEDNPDTTKYVNVPNVDPLAANNVQTKTVGVDLIAVGTTDSSLIIRLGSLRAQACSLNWVTDATVCSSLQTKLDKATKDLHLGHNASAKTDLQGFNSLLTANHGPGTSNKVGDSAYWLLKVNADYLIGRM